jgi:c-di-GMP-binding flagellar brake protein YcgR
MSQRIERRRTPRTELPDEEVCGVEIRQRIQLLDISQSGVLLACEAPLPVGTRGQLRTGLAALPFCADVAVRRHAGGPVHPRSVMAAQFAAIDERSTGYLEQFLVRGKPSGT